MSTPASVKSPPGAGPQESRRRRSASRSRSESRSRRRRDDESGTRRRRRREGGTSRSPSPRRGSVKEAAPAPHPAPSQDFTSMKISGYDEHDKAPEDRLVIPSGSVVNFDPAAPVVRGNLSIEGVNYSTFEAHRKEKPHYADKFTDALKEDIISEVGNGVRKDDIALNVCPGAVKTVVLEYDEGNPQQIRSGEWKQAPPKLVNAEWDFTVDYVIRAKSAGRQQRIAAAMYQALSSDEGLSTYKTKHAYVKWLDPVYGDPFRVVIRKPAVAAEAVSESQKFSQSGPNHVPPPATRAVSPTRAVPADGAYPDAPPRSKLVTDLHHAQQSPLNRGVVEVPAATPPRGSVYNPHATTPDADRMRARRLEDDHRTSMSPYSNMSMYTHPQKSLG